MNDNHVDSGPRLHREVFSPGFAVQGRVGDPSLQVSVASRPSVECLLGSLFRGAALEVPDDSLQAWPAASTAAFNGVRIPGEKTSLQVRPHKADFAAALGSTQSHSAALILTPNVTTW